MKSELELYKNILDNIVNLQAQIYNLQDILNKKGVLTATEVKELMDSSLGNKSEDK